MKSTFSHQKFVVFFFKWKPNETFDNCRLFISMTMCSESVGLPCKSRLGTFKHLTPSYTQRKQIKSRGFIIDSKNTLKRILKNCEECVWMATVHSIMLLYKWNLFIQQKRNGLFYVIHYWTGTLLSVISP